MRVAIDIDGVLADVRMYIQQYLMGEKKDWKAFFLLTTLFPAIKPMKELVRSLAHNHELYLVTGRPESNREKTDWWLRAHIFAGLITPQLNYSLLMRPNGDKRSGTEIKLEWFRKVEPDLILDDSLETVEAPQR